MANQQAANRLAVISKQVSVASSLGQDPHFPQATTAALFPPAVYDTLGIDALLTPSARATRDKVRAFAEQRVAPVIADFWEKAEFPYALVPELGKLGINGFPGNGPHGNGLSLLEAAMAAVELARVDASTATFFLVHNYLSVATIALLGSEAQKHEYIPRMSSLEWVGCWGLTEPSNGSDASALTTTATKVNGGWELNGTKRWIGNGTWAEVNVIWARNTDTNQVNAFILHKDAPGFRTSKIENKIALRCVQNADMEFERCFVPDSARLPGVTSFKDTNKVLALSRIMVGWLPVGMAMGVYDMAHRYLLERKQFGTQLAAFQLLQEKLVRILGNVQAMFMMAHRLTQLYEEGDMTHEQASLVKAWNTLRGRECVALARELLGGNGVVSDFHVAKAFCDFEAIYTYEGTYEVNVLVAGRGATGVSAIKALSKPPRSATEVQA